MGERSIIYADKLWPTEEPKSSNETGGTKYMEGIGQHCCNMMAWTGR